MKPLEMTGWRFGLLTVVRLNPQRGNDGAARWDCLCDCGRESTVVGRNLRSGSIRSCGCRQGSISHGMRYTKTYTTWQHIVNRCTNPRDRSYPNYGGRGIKLCQRWRLFENFFADMGECPVGLMIDRIDNNGDYVPGNCRWTDRKTQNRNTRANRLITFASRTQCMAAWAEELGVKAWKIRDRLNAGLPVNLALKPEARELEAA